MTNKELIQKGQAVMGLEFGSTRIKAVLINDNFETIAKGSHSWKSSYENGIWTYSLEDIISGLQDCYAGLAKNVKDQYGIPIRSLASIGISAMMHGYIALDKNDELLTPFRTWQNTITEEAASELSELFGVNIPQRWSIAHLYQAILNAETHIPDISFLTTLAGYIHYRLTGKRVLGIGDASGMFPINSQTKNYDARMIGQFAELISNKQYPWYLTEILPRVLVAGDSAGTLTNEGAALLDPTGTLQPGIPFAPPEGDAGTGMAATNSVRVNTGNVSAGTSIFGMLVLKKPLSRAYETIDMVTTPSGDPVAMVHCNNCTSELNSWVSLFSQFAEGMGCQLDEGDIYHYLFTIALQGAPDCGGLTEYNLLSGEPVLESEGGKSEFIRTVSSRMDLPNFMRAQLYSCVAALASGFRVFNDEGVRPEKITGHGGYFKQEDVGQRFLAAALNLPITVMETADEGGAWGMAILTKYMLERDRYTLEDYLDSKAFKRCRQSTVTPDLEDVNGFTQYLDRFLEGLHA